MIFDLASDVPCSGLRDPLEAGVRAEQAGLLEGTVIRTMALRAACGINFSWTCL